jgi:hypothetical protein
MPVVSSDEFAGDNDLQEDLHVRGVDGWLKYAEISTRVDVLI